MQEEVENKTLTLMVNGTRLTGRMFKAAISKYMAHRREVKHQKQQKRDSPVIPHGKQTVKQLIGQNQGVSNIEINDPSMIDRNHQLVEAAGLLLAVFNGVRRSGTGATVNYARKLKRGIVIIHPISMDITRIQGGR